MPSILKIVFKAVFLQKFLRYKDGVPKVASLTFGKPLLEQALKSNFMDGSDGVRKVRKVVRKVCFRKVFTAHMSLVLQVRFEEQTIQISEAFHISEKNS